MDKRFDILVIDRRPIFAEGVKRLLAERGSGGTIRCATTRSEALDALSDWQPQLAMIEIDLPDGDGIGLIREIHVNAPDCRVLVLSDHDELKYGGRALRAGARGFLMKCAGVEVLFEALEVVKAGRCYCSPVLSQQVMQSFGSDDGATPVDGLSEREFQIFRLLADGRNGKEVADLLKISPKTVDSHRDNMKRKLDCSSTLELSLYARDWARTGGDPRANI